MRDRSGALFYTVGELVRAGAREIPRPFKTTETLLYSSPATLAFHSPGAEGFGVKRAGLSIPGSVMLVVSPGCCARNTSSISAMPGYENRFFYLTMNETDLVTGRHLKKIPAAVEKICGELGRKPSVVMICITCVDALLGTDMERVCRKAQEKTGVRVRPCYMYALTREGRRPPMVHVRQSLYALLEKRPRKRTSVNILGYFAPLEEDCELPALLGQAGVKAIRSLPTAADYDAFLEMAEANFNLVLHPEARPAALDLEERLGIPAVELTRLYQIDRIAQQYAALGSVLGVRFDDEAYRKEAEAVLEAFRKRHADAVFSVGEALNGDPFELALALVRSGFAVAEIFGTVTEASYPYLRRIAAVSPDTRVYSSLHPSMIHYEADPAVTLCVGRDAGYYHRDLPCLQWSSDVQPFGYRGAKRFYEALTRLAEGGTDAGAAAAAYAPSVQLRGSSLSVTPFAPDQSGAVSVLFGLGGITVICDAGGCTGNICGFDEPRWLTRKSALFSAGLRDMDAIMGRDRDLVRKLAEAAQEDEYAFAAVIGTPVPAVIGTDLQAISRMVKKKTGLPVLAIPTTGMAYYDAGAEKAWLALADTFCPAGEVTVRQGRLGILGATPMDLGDPDSGMRLKELLLEEGWREPVCCGMGDGLDRFKEAGSAAANLVVSVSAYEAAKVLRDRFGTPFTCENPLAARAARGWNADWKGKKVLVVHEQITANSIRDVLVEEGAASVTAGSFFMMKKDLMKEGDLAFSDAAAFASAVRRGSYDVIAADPVCREMVPAFEGAWIPLVHFAVSGHTEEERERTGSERR